MRVVAISDLHGFLPSVMPEGDVLLIAGDVVVDNFSGIGMWDRKDQAQWMYNKFAKWLERQSFDHILGIAGNHDYVLQGKLARRMPWTYLEDESIEIDGLVFHGSPWVPTFGGWAFMKPDRELPEHWDRIPKETDVLITHGPPWGYGDLTDSRWGPPEHVGSSSLRWRLDNDFPNLKLHVFGHIHPARGVWEESGRKFANVTHVNNDYKPIHHAMVFDV